MKLVYYLFAMCFSLVCCEAHCQTDTSFLPRATNLLKNQPPTEKVYLHLDKQDYGFGDTIWYKAYTVIGEHHQLSALSGVLYVELISPKDSLITRQIITLVSGVGWSDIPLAHTLKQGSYRLRAYTNWMRNAESDYFYNQRIRIGGIPVDLNAEKQTTQATPDVQFFPEGGELVNGVRSRVAFKAINSKGLGEDIKGTIIDNDGNIVADFATQHLGMGVFAFTPQSGKTYTARISNPGETRFTVDLPKAQEDGYTLAVNNSLPDSIYIKVAVNEKTSNEQKNKLFYIIAQSAGKVYYTSQGKLEDLIYTAKVERSRFPSGIAQFTLFSQIGEPLAERIAFVQNKDTLKLNITAPAYTLSTRQRIKINLDAKDPDNNSITGSFSASVINDSQAATDDLAESTILNNLFLTSDLKGYIEQPNYYFINPNEQTKSDLDVLMLTQGYRRFDWKQMLNKTPAIPFQPEKSLELSGTVKTPSGQPVPDGKVTLLAVKQNLLNDTTTDPTGAFKFTDLRLADTSNLVLKARKANNDDKVIISIKPPDCPEITAMAGQYTGLALLQPQARELLQKKFADYQQEQKLDYLKNGIQLKPVNIHGYRPPKAPELIHSDNLNGPGHADQIIMGDQVRGCVTLSDCLEGRLLGVRFTMPSQAADHKGERVPYLSRDLGRFAAAPAMAVIVDGIVMEGNHLDDINSDDIYSIEVLRSGSYLTIYGSNASGGALVITTRRGGEDSKKLSARPLFGLLAYPFVGYYKARTFYSPKYNGPKTDKQPADERSTIYWNPNILTDKNGKASFEYFNNDTKGTYRVVVEGIDDNGNLGRAVYRYKVE